MPAHRTSEPYVVVETCGQHCGSEVRSRVLLALGTRRTARGRRGDAGSSGGGGFTVQPVIGAADPHVSRGCPAHRRRGPDARRAAVGGRWRSGRHIPVASHAGRRARTGSRPGCRSGYLCASVGARQSRCCSASAAASRSAAHRTPGRRPIRSTGPDTDTAATTVPAASRTGADTLATPASRSATLCAHPRRRTSSERALGERRLGQQRALHGGVGPRGEHLGARSGRHRQPASPTGTVSRRPLAGSAAATQTRWVPSRR